MAARAGMLSSSTSHSGRIVSVSGMDSILSHLATSVAMGTWQIHAYFKDLRITDRAVNAFTSELESMAIACEVIGKLITEHSEQREEQMQQLWDCLEARLRACNNTVSQLELAIDSAKQGLKKDKTALGRMIRQIRKDGSSKDTDEARSEIQTHTVSLQVIIHTARIQFLYLSTGTADQSMCAELSLLKAKKQGLQKLRAHRSPKQFDPLNKNETEILRISDAIVFSSESLYASSVSAGSQMANQAPNRATYTQTWIGSITCDPPTPETDTPSVFSHPRSRGFSNPLTPETDTPSVFSRSPDRRASVVEDPTEDKVSTLQNSAFRAQPIDSESDDEIDIDIETIRRLITSGRSFFEKNELAQASSRLSEARKMVTELPEQREDAVNLFELLYMIGICAFYLEEPSETVSPLQGAIEQHRKSNNVSRVDKMQVAEMNHLLARTFLKLQELENARTSCQEALKSRRKLLGKSHESYFESLELMADIWEADGNSIRAQVYRDMLAEGRITNAGRIATPQSLSRQASGPEKNPITGTRVRSSHFEEAGIDDALAKFPKPLSMKRKPISTHHIQQVSEADRDTFKEVSPTSARITNVAFGPLASDMSRQDRADYPYPFRFTESAPATSIIANQTAPDHVNARRERSIEAKQIQQSTEGAAPYKSVQRTSTLAHPQQMGAPPLLSASRSQTDTTLINTAPTQPRLLRASSNIPFVPATSSSQYSVAPLPSDSSTTGLDNAQVQATNQARHGRPDSIKPPQTTPLYRAEPANYELRRLWALFFEITSRKELSQALLENRRQDALSLIPEGYQKKKLFSSKLLKSKGSSPIERRDLQLAALFADADIVDKLLASGTDLAYNRNDLEGVSPLHCAALGGSYQLTANLITARQPAEVVLDKFGTPLSLAVLSERTDVVDLLLANTLNPHVKCGNLGSVFHAACMTGNAALLDHLSQKMGKSALDASAIVYPSVVRKLRSMIVSRSLSDLPDEATLVHDSAEHLEHMDARPLAVAAYLGCEKIVEYLLSQKNVDINAKCGAWSAPNMDDPKGSNEHSALTMAAAGGHDGILRLLLQKGANFTPRNFEREDALLTAVLNGRTTCALLLLEHGAPVSSTSFREATKRSMLPLVTKMRAKRAGLHSSKMSTLSNDKSGVVFSAESVSEAFS